jgi:hypothetical protein
MKHIKIYENFQEGPMRKPEGFFSSIARGAKHAMGFEKEEDRKSLESIHRFLNDNYLYDWVKNIREIKPGVIVAWVNDSSITVDKNTPEILFKGKVLDLHNTEDEVDSLYNRLMRISQE